MPDRVSPAAARRCLRAKGRHRLFQKRCPPMGQNQKVVFGACLFKSLIVLIVIFSGFQCSMVFTMVWIVCFNPFLE